MLRPLIHTILKSGTTPKLQLQVCGRSNVSAKTARVALIALLGINTVGVTAENPQVVRGRYLVKFGGCNDCHTPGYFLGKPDAARELGGSDVGFEVPGVGTFVGPNLTPDPETGLGRWTAEQISTALRSGVRPDGRVLSTVMPWQAFSHLNSADVTAIVAYLRQLPPVRHKAAGPFAAGEPPTTFVWRIVAPPAGSSD
jgi:mono/diheme cytochrome c family protein